MPKYLDVQMALAIILFVLAANTGQAQQLDVTAVCGGPAESLSDQSKVTLEGQARTLASAPDVKEEAKHQVQQILVDRGRSDVSRELHYIMSISCAIVLSDSALTTDEKLTRIMEMKQMLQFPSQPQRLGESPSLDKVSADNTSTYVGRGRWDWTIFVAGSPEQIGGIRCVVYHLHPTFPDPDRKVCSPGSNASRAFPLSSNGWGTFTVAIDLEGKDGSIDRILYPLQFSSK